MRVDAHGARPPIDLTGQRQSSADRARCATRPSTSLTGRGLDELIRTRRTHKAYAPGPVDRRDARRAVRARPLGAEPQPHEPVALPRARPARRSSALKDGRGPGGGGQARPRADARRRLRRAGRATRSPRRRTSRRRACAVYIVLLAAHDRGLGGYWRTPGVLRTPEGRAACGIAEGERVLGLIHLGEARGREARARAGAARRDPRPPA